MALNPELLEILACPKCKGDIAPVDDEAGLACRTCNIVYPVREDIPIMLIEEAVPEEDWKNGVRSVK